MTSGPLVVEAVALLMPGFGVRGWWHHTSGIPLLVALRLHSLTHPALADLPGTCTLKNKTTTSCEVTVLVSLNLNHLQWH